MSREENRTQRKTLSTVYTRPSPGFEPMSAFSTPHWFISAPRRNRIIFSIVWLAPWAGKMNQILRCDWLPERARWSYLVRSGLPAVSRKKNFSESHIITPLLTQLVRSRLLILASFSFCVFMDLDSVSVHKHAKKELGQYPAILTSHLVNNPYIYFAGLYKEHWLSVEIIIV